MESEHTHTHAPLFHLKNTVEVVWHALAFISPIYLRNTDPKEPHMLTFSTNSAPKV